MHRANVKSNKHILAVSTYTKTAKAQLTVTRLSFLANIQGGSICNKNSKINPKIICARIIIYFYKNIYFLAM